VLPPPPVSANDFCREGRRTTISANDVYQALKELDFEEFVEPLQAFLASEWVQYNGYRMGGGGVWEKKGVGIGGVGGKGGQERK
jgi:hypothetical protein